MPSTRTKLLANLLHENATASLDALGASTGSTRQNVSKHLGVLVNEKLVTYSVLENPNVVNARVFFIEIKTNPEEPDVISSLENIPGVRSIDGIIGQNSLIVKFVARSAPAFTSILDRVDGIITGTRFQHYRIIECLTTFKDGGKVLARGAELASGKDEVPAIDERDSFILDLLQVGLPERPTYEFLLDKLKYKFADVSYAQIRKRVQRMQERGVIDSFTIKIPPEAISKTDYRFKFYISIIPKRLFEYNSIASGMLAMEDRITELYRTGQEYGLFAVCRTRSIEEYRHFLEMLYATGKIQDTVSTLVVDEKLPATFAPFDVPQPSNPTAP